MKISKKSFLICLHVFAFIAIILLSCFIGQIGSERKKQSKILFEYANADKAISVTDDYADVPDEAYVEDDEYCIQIMFDYEHYSDAMYDENHENNETFLEYSKKYHTNNNGQLLKRLGFSNVDVFVSEYSPYVFLKYEPKETLSEISAVAEKIADHSFVSEIRIYPSNIYELDLESLEPVSAETDVDEPMSVQPTASTSDLRITRYENFPVGTPYKGSGIKIGLLDTGIFNTSHSNFSDITVENVYDTYTKNDGTSSAYHPTWVASVLGGKYGYASAASIYYVDVNSENGYVGIERLINKGVKIVNMSISANSCANNGEYNTGLEGYLDYIYTSTKVIMVASAGNYLDKEGSGGYVALPALCANVISVGSVTSSGVPSTFSSYNIKNDVSSNPNLVAVGSSRYIGGYSSYYSGTSFSAPAVTGAIAMYFGKNGVKELPAVLSILSATANDSAVSKATRTISMYELDSSGNYVLSGNTITCTNNKKSNGSYERTGAGLLDVTALMNYSNSLINYEITFTSNEDVELKEIYLAAGDTLRVSLAWQRNATLKISKFLWWETGRTYTSEKLADLDLKVYNSAGSLVAVSQATGTNVEILSYTAPTSGYYTIKVKPFANYADTHCINYAYRIS